MCSYDLHYNVLWDRCANEEIVIPREKDFHAKSIVAVVFECYFFITNSCIVMYVGTACIIMYK